MISPVDDDLDALVVGARGAVPRLNDLPWNRRRGMVRLGRDVAKELIEAGRTDPDEIAERVETELRLQYAREDDEFGNPFIIAIIAGLVQFLVIRLLERLFPDRRVEFQRYGKPAT